MLSIITLWTAGRLAFHAFYGGLYGREDTREDFYIFSIQGLHNNHQKKKKERMRQKKMRCAHLQRKGMVIKRFVGPEGAIWHWVITEGGRVVEVCPSAVHSMAKGICRLKLGIANTVLPQPSAGQPKRCVQSKHLAICMHNNLHNFATSHHFIGADAMDDVTWPYKHGSKLPRALYI